MSAAHISIRNFRPSNSFTKNNVPCLDGEHQRHLQRAGAHPTYRGPVHTVETVYVPCGWCGTPVDPVSRVPVGRMFFHPQCLRCVICGKLSSRTLPFVARKGQPVCATCDRNKSVSLPPLRASAFAERAQAAISGVGTLRALMERSATRSPTRRGHAIEMQQLATQQRDPNILLISAEKQHELDKTIQSARAQSESKARDAVNSQVVVAQQQQQQLQGGAADGGGATPMILPQRNVPTSGRRASNSSTRLLQQRQQQ